MDFFQNLHSDFLFPLCEFQMLKKIIALPNRHLSNFIDILSAHSHRKRLRLEPRPVAGIAGNIRHVVLIGFPHLIGIRFLIATGKQGHDPLKGNMVLLVLPEHVRIVKGIPFLPGTAEQNLLGLPIDILPGRIQPISVFFQNRFHDAHGIGMGIFRQGSKYTASHGKFRIRQYKFLIEFHVASQSRAFRTCSVGIVERKHAGGELRQADAAIHTGKILAEHQKFSINDLHIDDAFPHLNGRFQGIRQSVFHALLHSQAVNHHLNGVFLILFQGNILAYIIHFAVHPDANIAFLSDMLEYFFMFAFLAPYDLRHDEQPRALRQFQQTVDHLIHRLLSDGLSALRTVGMPCPRKHQPQIIVDFRDGSHCGAGIVACGLLIYGNSRREPLNIVHIRLVHLPQKLPGIRGQGFHVPPLSLCINGVKGQRGFPRP